MNLCLLPRDSLQGQGEVSWKRGTRGISGGGQTKSGSGRGARWDMPGNSLEYSEPFWGKPFLERRRLCCSDYMKKKIALKMI